MGSTKPDLVHSARLVISISKLYISLIKYQAHAIIKLVSFANYQPAVGAQMTKLLKFKVP